PGVFRELVQATVTRWGALPAGVGCALEARVPGLTGSARTWIEALAPQAAGARVMATYRDGPYAGQAAMTSNALGKGCAWYVGWLPTVAQALALLQHLLPPAGVQPLADLSPGLVAARRGPHTVLLNFTDSPLTATVQG